jgi:hypothetical protein
MLAQPVVLNIEGVALLAWGLPMLSSSPLLQPASRTAMADARMVLVVLPGRSGKRELFIPSPLIIG